MLVLTREKDDPTLWRLAIAKANHGPSFILTYLRETGDRLGFVSAMKGGPKCRPKTANPPPPKRTPNMSDLHTAQTASDIVAATARALWAKHHDSEDCPSEQIPSEAELREWCTGEGWPTAASLVQFGGETYKWGTIALGDSTPQLCLVRVGGTNNTVFCRDLETVHSRLVRRALRPTPPHHWPISGRMATPTAPSGNLPQAA